MHKARVEFLLFNLISLRPVLLHYSWLYLPSALVAAFLYPCFDLQSLSLLLQFLPEPVQLIFLTLVLSLLLLYALLGLLNLLLQLLLLSLSLSPLLAKLFLEEFHVVLNVCYLQRVPISFSVFKIFHLWFFPLKLWGFAVCQFGWFRIIIA